MAASAEGDADKEHDQPSAAKNDEDEQGSIAVAQVDEQNMKMMQELMKAFTPEQEERYIAYRRSSLDKSALNKLLEEIAGKKKKGCGYLDILLLGCAKIFVGELVEHAVELREKEGIHGPVQPRHYLEAYRVLKNSGRIGRQARYRPYAFRK